MDGQTVITIQRPVSSGNRHLKPKQLRRFYEPAVLFKALTQVAHQGGTVKSPERTPAPQTPEERYRRYIDRLANVCDRKKRGSTVTAMAVLDTDDAFVYVLGCNQVSDDQLRETAEFVKSLLDMLARVHNIQTNEKRLIARREILELLLVFNRPRIEQYIMSLRRDLDGCIALCGNSKTGDALEKGLRELRLAVGDIKLENLDQSAYLEFCWHCLHDIKTFRTPTTNKFVDERADAGRLHDHSMSCWSELRHHLTRLMAYISAIRTFIDAAKEWPEIFSHFDIWAIPSSTRTANPLGKRSENARNIIGRMSSQAVTTETYRALAEGLQREHYDLDARIQDECQKEDFKPFVHCEVLVLDWILRKFRRPEFFQGYGYIGTSKPACKLCESYFRAHPSFIQARPSHGNVYTSWAFPDILVSDGESMVRRRQSTFNSMIESMRNDAFRLLEDRSPVGKRHDSGTYALVSQLQESFGEEVGGSGTSEAEDLAEQLERELRIDAELTPTADTVSDSEDEEGGASLG